METSAYIRLWGQTAAVTVIDLSTIRYFFFLCHSSEIKSFKNIYLSSYIYDGI